MNKIYFIILAAVATLTMASCEKVSPIGVLVSGTGVEDRVKVSHLYYQEHKSDFNIEIAENGDYTFLVGADSHVTDDMGRMEEMLQIGLDANDLFYAHLGDIADTKAEYYINLEKTLDKYKHKYCAKKYKEIPFEKLSMRDWDGLYIDELGDTVRYEQIHYPFYPVVGNHDLTHNGWPLWCNIFHSSFYQFDVYVNGTDKFDHFIFLDTASGTLGEEQVKLIEEGVLDAHAKDNYFKCR